MPYSEKEPGTMRMVGLMGDMLPVENLGGGAVLGDYSTWIVLVVNSQIVGFRIQQSHVFIQ